MKVKLSKADLNAAMQLVMIGVAGGEDEHWKCHYLFRLRDGKVEMLSSNDMRLCALAPLPMAEHEDMDEGNTFTVPGWRLRVFVSAVKNDDDIIALDFKDGVTKASVGGKSPGRFASLNPKDFPFWESLYEEAKSVGRIAGDRLAKALSHTRHFISDQEAKSATLVATEYRDGVFLASDTAAVSMVTLAGFSQSNMRIHGKDISAVLTFLALKGSEEVEVREQERCVFFVRPDGGVLGVNRWIYDFPLLNVAKDAVPKAWFEVETADLLRTMRYLSAFAKKEDNKLNFLYEDGNMLLSVASGSGSGDKDAQPVACVEHSDMDALSAARPEGFSLSKEYVEMIAAEFGSKTLRFGVIWTEKKTGYVRFRMDRNGDDYLAVISWRK